MTVVANSLIALDDLGRAWIEGANTKVIEVAIDHARLGWSADEINRQHPHLSLAQIHAALSYYFERKAEFDSLIDSQATEARKAREAQGENTPVHQRLRRLGKI